jgi:hypothetical protein
MCVCSAHVRYEGRTTSHVPRLAQLDYTSPITVEQIRLTVCAIRETLAVAIHLCTVCCAHMPRAKWKVVGLCPSTKFVSKYVETNVFQSMLNQKFNAQSEQSNIVMHTLKHPNSEPHTKPTKQGNHFVIRVMRVPAKPAFLHEVHPTGAPRHFEQPYT